VHRRASTPPAAPGAGDPFTRPVMSVNRSGVQYGMTAINVYARRVVRSHGR
jgi:hypothetical protein